MPSINKTFDVYLCNQPDPTRKGKTRVARVAVERGPLDPCVWPDGAIRKLGTFLAPNGRTAIAAQSEDRQRRARQ